MDWHVWDHGDPAVDEFWRKVVGRGSNSTHRHAPLGGAIPPADAAYVPPEFQDHGRYDFESLRICEAILAAS